MNIVTQKELIQQTNALAEESTLLEIYADAAEEKVLSDTCCTLAELLEKGGGQQFPAMIHLAVLLLVGHWYRNREATSTINLYNVPLGYDALVKRFRKFKTGWRNQSSSES